MSAAISMQLVEESRKIREGGGENFLICVIVFSTDSRLSQLSAPSSQLSAVVCASANVPQVEFSQPSENVHLEAAAKNVVGAPTF